MSGCQFLVEMMIPEAYSCTAGRICRHQAWPTELLLQIFLATAPLHPTVDGIHIISCHFMPFRAISYESIGIKRDETRLGAIHLPLKLLR